MYGVCKDSAKDSRLMGTKRSAWMQSSVYSLASSICSTASVYFLPKTISSRPFPLRKVGRMKKIWRGTALFLILGGFKTFFLSNIFSVLVNECSGGHQLKNKQRGPVLSSLEETHRVNSEDNNFLKNDLDESPKAEVTSDDNNVILRERAVEPDGKTKRGVKRKRKFAKPATDQVGAKRFRENAKKKKKLHKGRQQGKRKSSNRHRKKEKVEIKIEGKQIEDPGKKAKKQMSRANQKKRVIKGRRVKEFQENEPNCGRSSRDTECIDKWAAYTSLGLTLAPSVIKQVSNFFFLTFFRTFLQVNSILASDRTVIRKKAKKDDFLEHHIILQQALAANPCNVGKESTSPYGKNPIHNLHHMPDQYFFPALLETLANCKEKIEGCGTPLTGSSSQHLRSQQILDEITSCKEVAGKFITG